MAEPVWHPGKILELSGSYWQACTLHTGVKLDLFTLIGDGVMTPDQLARRAAADVRGIKLLLNALSAMGLINKTGDSYANTAAAVEFLDRNSKSYIGHMIMHHHYLVAPWAQMDLAVRTGQPVGRREGDRHEENLRREAFLMGMYNIASQQAPQIASEIDLGNRKRVLDLGGGPGTYAINFCRRNPKLTAVIYDLPATRPYAEKTVARHGLADRISFCSGNYIEEEIPGRYDVVWLSHILHSEGSDTCEKILSKAVNTLESGGMLLIHDFFLWDTMDGPLFPALFALNMLQATSEGQTYSEAHVKQMLQNAGLSDIKRLTYAGPTQSGIIVGTVEKA
jgi:ubiquinone/menaquinone biosynthesis C-methylase UbiE